MRACQKRSRGSWVVFGLQLVQLGSLRLTEGSGTPIWPLYGAALAVLVAGFALLIGACRARCVKAAGVLGGADA